MQRWGRSWQPLISWNLLRLKRSGNLRCLQRGLFVQTAVQICPWGQKSQIDSLYYISSSICIIKWMPILGTLRARPSCDNTRLELCQIRSITCLRGMSHRWCPRRVKGITLLDRIPSAEVRNSWKIWWTQNCQHCDLKTPSVAGSYWSH